ncbi:acyltransferase family protein [Alteraurantiacibacter palmitatis]|uniref:Acyltransferase family protein n=1 Tax=Alteraurantiacibacter palmitatis TaxID=2054628 RepID=A0ABV7E6E9_9SPHN
MTHPAYRPEIDGLRAVAIIPVVLFHAKVPGFGGGFAGVDVFFVISGYLITRIIMAQLAEGRFTLAGFFERRARRILPPIFPVLLASTLAAWAILTPPDFRQFAQSLAATALFGANFLFARSADYFTTQEGFTPLIHMWSLAVEEQFYLLFPPLLLILWKANRRLIVPAVLIVALGGLALAILAAPRHPLLAFYLLPTRMWELAVGSLCALAIRHIRPNGTLALAGLALIAAGFALIGEETSVPGPMMLLPVGGASLVILFAGTQNSAGRLLALRPLVGIGLVSFGLYLWHQPLFAIAHYQWLGPLPGGMIVAIIAMATALATMSWRWIEQPVRSRRILASRNKLAMACLAGTLLAAGAGLGGHLRLIEPRSASIMRQMDGARPAHFDQSVVIPDGAPLPFILYGDSHAGQYYPAFVERLGNGALLSENGCLSAPGINGWPDQPACARHVDRLIELAGDRQPPLVIWAQRWERELFDSATGQSLGALADGEGAVLFAAVDRLLGQLPPQTRLLLVGNSPTAWAAGDTMWGGWLRCRAYLNADCPVSYPAGMAEGRAESRLLAAYAAQNPRVDYLDAAAPLCPDGRCTIRDGDRLLYWDGSHLTVAAARRVVDSLDVRALAIPAPLP